MSVPSRDVTAAPPLAPPNAAGVAVGASPIGRRYDRSIVDGPLAPAVWRIAWPTMLTNIIGGLQGIIDHAMVGNLVGFTGNAAIGVSWQIFIIVIVFISSLFTGMSVLVSRFVGAGDSDKADRTVYQAFLTATFLSFGIIAPVGYFVSPWLLDFVNAAPAVRSEALPFLRIMFLFSGGMMMFFMLGTALRAAGDARTPMVLGVAMTVLNAGLNVILIRGLGPIPAFGTAGAAMGTCIASAIVSIYSLMKLLKGGWVVGFPRHHGFAPDWAIIGMHGGPVVAIGVQLLRVLSVSGLFIAVALTYTGGLQGTGDTKSPLYISIISQVLVPLGICFVIKRTSQLDPIDIWIAILVGHITRCTLSVLRFNQGKWRTIAVDIERRAKG